MRALVGCALGLGMVLALTASSSAADEKIDGKKLIGKWEPKEVPPGAKLQIEVTKDGKVLMSVEFAGKKETAEGSYKLDGNKLTVTLKGPGGKEEKDEMTIEKLTDDELTTKDSKGKVETLKRVKDKK